LRPARKASRTQWLCYDPRCGFLKVSLRKDDYGSSNLNGFVYMNSDDFALRSSEDAVPIGHRLRFPLPPIILLY
jgi:hypothetical protein